MNRRTLLVAAGATSIGLSGCQRAEPREGESGPDESTDEDETEAGLDGAATDGELRILGVYADEIERPFVDYEYVHLENVAEEPLDVSGYAVDYGSGHAYAIEDLTLEPGAALVVLSRTGENTTLTSSPPIYLRFAGFDWGTDTPVLDENGRVAVSAVVAEVRYEDDGCDGGTVTPQNVDEQRTCVHGE